MRRRAGLLPLALLLCAGAPAGAARADGAAPAPAAKRVAPPKVPTVRAGGLRFEVIHWGRQRGLPQNGGYVAAFDGRTGKELWVLQVYATAYDPNLEQDVQDVFIESMRWNARRRVLEIRDERGRHFTVDPATRTVRGPTAH